MWISVKDRLPEKGERVLVAVEDTTVFEAFLNSYNEWCRGGIEMEKWYGKVTHWQPLPKAPKEVYNNIKKQKDKYEVGKWQNAK